jgi:hypothetical protein
MLASIICTLAILLKGKLSMIVDLGLHERPILAIDCSQCRWGMSLIHVHKEDPAVHVMAVYDYASDAVK